MLEGGMGGRALIMYRNSFKSLKWRKVRQNVGGEKKGERKHNETQ